MTWRDWFWTTWTDAGMAALSTVVIYAAIIVYARLSGLRSFSKMSAFDFAMTIALGSLFASTIASPSPTLLLALLCFGMLFVCQKAIAVARGWRAVKAAVDNAPLLLMADGEILHDNLRRSQVTRDDLRAKLREAGVLDYSRVKAVVFETTGDLSVLQGGPDDRIDPDLLNNVRTT